MIRRWLHSMGSNSHHLLQITIWLAVISSFTYGSTSSNVEKCASLSTDGVTIPRGDIVIEEGKSLEIFCKLHDSYMNRENHLNSSFLSFKQDDHVIPSELIEIVNATTIRMYVQNVNSSSSMFYCNNNSTIVCLNKVAVDTKPRALQNFSCISYNWQNLTCSWKVPKHYIKTDYSVAYFLPGRAGRHLGYACPNNVRHVPGKSKDWFTCHWDITTSPMYRQPYTYMKFQIFANNTFGNKTFNHHFHHYARVKPAREENLIFINRTAHSATLAWNQNIGMINFPQAIIYRIMYQSSLGRQYEIKNFKFSNNWTEIIFPKSDLKNYTDKLNHSQYIYELKGLSYAHCLYDVRVQSKVGIARDEEMWSDFAAITFRTLSELPSRAPKTNVGSFSIWDNAQYRDIYVYWQKIQDDEQNGENFKYSVIVREDGHVKTIQPNKTDSSYAFFVGLSFAEYEFEIFSTNELGNSSESSIVRVPRNRSVVPEPRRFYKIAFNEHTYELSWKPPNLGPQDRPVTNYTLFWCRNDKDYPYPCSGKLHWETISHTVRSINKTMDDSGLYLFAISANTEVGSSGMTWAQCTVVYDKTIGRMKNVWIGTVGSTFIDLNWKLDCSEGIGIIIGYRIYYCVIKNPENPQCIGSEQNLTISGDLTTMNGNVTNLKPYTTYRLSVAVITINKEGPRSDEKLNTTLESCPETPLNVHFKPSGITNSSVTLVWEPPAVTNGRLQEYQIQCFYGGLLIRDLKANKDQREITINDLRSYTTHNIEIKACTVCCSKPIRMNVTTFIGVPGKMAQPTIIRLNQSHTQFSWMPPKLLGGPIQYELKSEVKVNGNLLVNIYNCTVGKLTVSTEICEREITSDITFLWFVRAVTIDVNGNRLAGQWSDSVVTTCNRATSPSLLIYFLVVMLFVIILSICVFTSKKAWTQWKQMKEIVISLPPGLATVTPDAQNWNRNMITPSKGQKDRPQDSSLLEAHYSIPAVEPLIGVKDRFFGITDTLRDGRDSTDTSNCDNSTNSEESSLDDSGCRHDSSSPIPVSNIEVANLPIDQDLSTIRLRKPIVPPANLIDNANTVNSTLNSYVTIPLPEKAWSKAMQLKPLDGYSQIAVETQQMQTPPVRLGPTVNPGRNFVYVPHHNIANPQKSVPIMIPKPVQLKPNPPTQLKEPLQTVPKTSQDGHSLSPPSLSPQQSFPSNDDDDDCENSECKSSESLVDLPLSSSSDDDFIDIEENLELLNVEVTLKPEHPSKPVSEISPYITLAQLPPKSFIAGPPALQNRQAIAAMVNLEPIISPTSANNSKPATPNPYSRVGMFESTPTMVLNSAPSSATPPTTPSSSASNTTPTTPSK